MGGGRLRALPPPGGGARTARGTPAPVRHLQEPAEASGRVRLRVVALLLLFGSLPLAGCVDPAGGVDDERAPAPWTPCAHPWPCADGSEWPRDLAGPFELLPPEPLSLASHDGTILAGHVWRPQLPEGAKAPVVIYSSPYFGMRPNLLVGGIDAAPSTSWPGWSEALFSNFTRAGFAVLLVSVRGTGESGGCLEWGGLDEQLDQVALVEWAASQPWSNGRVGFWGISYMGTTSLEAAIHQPPALKAIWAGGIISDWYLQGYSPQGLSGNGYAEFTLTRGAGIGLLPPTNLPAERQPEALARHPERVCPGTPDAFTRQGATTYADDRKPAWFEERRYVRHFSNVTAALLVPHGLQDNGGHRFQEDAIWDALPNAPKWFLLGQWGHTINFDEQLASYPHGSDGWVLTLRFFDFWLKGLGEPPRVGVVDYQTSTGAWRESAAWPPAEAREEALFLSGSALEIAPGSGSESFLASAAGGGTRPVRESPVIDEERGCGPEATRGTMLVFVSDPLPRATLAGNPYALLDLEADRPGGGFNVELLAFAGASPCDDPASVRLVAHGGVDLRFHDGARVGSDFPTGTRVPVRVDLWSLAHEIEEGHRLALALQPPLEETQPWSPTVTVHATSHVVLPLVDGTLGASPPPVAPPPSPLG